MGQDVYHLFSNDSETGGKSIVLQLFCNLKIISKLEKSSHFWHLLKRLSQTVTWRIGKLSVTQLVLGIPGIITLITNNLRKTSSLSDITKLKKMGGGRQKGKK